MPLNAVLRMNLAGVICGVPFSIDLAYKQVEPDPPLPQTTGRQLVERWFADDPGPWSHVRTKITEDLNFECASVSYDNEAETILLQDGQGDAVTPPLPTPLALQVNVPGITPNNVKDEGRFFMPGLLILDTFRGGIDPDSIGFFNTWMSRLLQVDNSSGTFRYLLYPHPKYTDGAGSTDTLADLPFWSMFLKVIGNRKADDCSTFAATGAGQFDPVVIPPTPGP